MVEIDGEKLMVSSSNFDDGSMIVSVGTTDFNNYGDSDFMEIMINKDGKIDYFTLPVGKDDYQRMYKIKPSHYGRMKTQNETNESAGGDFIRTDGDGKYGTSFGAEDIDDYIQRIFTFIDEKVGTEYFGSIEDEEEVIRFKQAFMDKFNEIEEPSIIDWNEIFSAESFGADSEKCPKCDAGNLGKEEMYYCYTCGNDDASEDGCSECGSDAVGEEEMDYCYNCGEHGHWFNAESFGAESDRDDTEYLEAMQGLITNFEDSFCPSCSWGLDKHTIVNFNGMPFAYCEKGDSPYMNAESFGAEFAGYEDPISERQRYRIRKLGGRIDKAMTRSDASKYIKSLMAMPLHAETTDCSACQGWGWNEDLNMVCDADGCIGGWVVPKKPSLLERGLELGAGVGMGMAGVAILFGFLGGTVGFAAEELKNRRD